MAEKPILFSDALVRAIIAGTKTETRRPIAARGRAAKLIAQATEAEGYTGDGSCLRGAKDALVRDCSPFGAAGDKLWIRECFAKIADVDDDDAPLTIVYRADGGDYSDYKTVDGDPFRWRPSIHMPREASRIMLEITEIRVERVQAIDEEGATREGIQRDDWGVYLGGNNRCRTSRDAFRCLWDSIYATEAKQVNAHEHPPSSWTANPFCWVVCFRRLS